MPKTRGLFHLIGWVLLLGREGGREGRWVGPFSQGGQYHVVVQVLQELRQTEEPSFFR